MQGSIHAILGFSIAPRFSGLYCHVCSPIIWTPPINSLRRSVNQWWVPDSWRIVRSYYFVIKTNFALIWSLLFICDPPRRFLVSSVSKITARIILWSLIRFLLGNLPRIRENILLSYQSSLWGSISRVFELLTTFQLGLSFIQYEIEWIARSAKPAHLTPNPILAYWETPHHYLSVE